MTTRKTITDITTSDQVYIQHEADDGFVIDPAEAMVLAREIIGHALALTAPEFTCEIDITLRVEA